MVSRRPLILIVDDGKQHVMLLRLALMQRGYAVIVAYSIEGARTMVKQRVVSALLIALEIEAAAKVLADLASHRPPVAIALTPHRDRAAGSEASPADDAARALEAGFDMALARPIDFAELDAALRERMTRKVSGTYSSIRAGAGLRGGAERGRRRGRGREGAA